MKKTLILIALLSCAGILSAQDTVLSVSPDASSQVVIQPQHFGYLSYNDVLHAMPQYQQAMKSLEELKLEDLEQAELKQVELRRGWQLEEMKKNNSHDMQEL